jgi:hypothetical protein
MTDPDMKKTVTFALCLILATCMRRHSASAAQRDEQIECSLMNGPLRNAPKAPRGVADSRLGLGERHLPLTPNRFVPTAVFGSDIHGLARTQLVLDSKLGPWAFA